METQSKDSGIRATIHHYARFALRLCRNPRQEFRTMERSGGFSQPLMFVVALGLVAGIARILVTCFYMANGADLGLFTALSAILAVPLSLVFCAYLGAFMLYMLWRALGSDEPLETAFRVVSYLTVIAPVAVLLSPVPYVGPVLILAALAYGLVLASQEVYGLKAAQTWLVFGIAFIVFAAAALHGDFHSRGANQSQPKPLAPQSVSPEPASSHH